MYVRAWYRMVYGIYYKVQEGAPCRRSQLQLLHYGSGHSSVKSWTWGTSSHTIRSYQFNASTTHTLLESTVYSTYTDVSPARHFPNEILV